MADVVAKTTEVVVQQNIDIPRITVVPNGEVTTGFHPFKLDVAQLHLQPGEREIVGQMVQHLSGYLSEAEVQSVLDRDRRLIAREIHAQMMAHFWEQATEYEVRVSRGFTELKPCNYTATAGQTARHFRETVIETGRIRQMLFGGFERCLYPLQKFDSDTERRFAVILERDALKWFNSARGQFQIYYKLGTEQPEYVPDFIVETVDAILMVETKARNELDTQEVRAKADAAVR